VNPSDPLPPSPPARRLGQALDRLGLGGTPPAALEEIVRNTFQGDPPLAELEAGLWRRGLALDPAALAQLAWGLLGVPRPPTVRLSAADPRLTHLAELHDVTLPSAARTLATRLAGERNLAPDLRRVRPALAAGGGDAATLLEAISREEGPGFLVLPGEFGPWAYVPSVADLQELSRAYGALVRAASGSRDAEVLAAALLLQGRSAAASPSLLARLEVTDYRLPRGAARPPRPPGPSAVDLVALEEACWAAAEQIAREQRARWARRG